MVYASSSAFAAQSDGEVVTWGHPELGGDSTSVAGALAGGSGVEVIYATDAAFAALKNDGRVVTWGDPVAGGDSTMLNLVDVRRLCIGLCIRCGKNRWHWSGLGSYS